MPFIDLLWMTFRKCSACRRYPLSTYPPPQGPGKPRPRQTRRHGRPGRPGRAAAAVRAARPGTGLPPRVHWLQLKFWGYWEIYLISPAKLGDMRKHGWGNPLIFPGKPWIFHIYASLPQGNEIKSNHGHIMCIKCVYIGMCCDYLPPFRWPPQQ
jgi:hypothetical protein